MRHLLRSAVVLGAILAVPAFAEEPKKGDPAAKAEAKQGTKADGASKPKPPVKTTEVRKDASTQPAKAPTDPKTAPAGPVKDAKPNIAPTTDAKKDVTATPPAKPGEVAPTTAPATKPATKPVEKQAPPASKVETKTAPTKAKTK